MPWHKFGPSKSVPIARTLCVSSILAGGASNDKEKEGPIPARSLFVSHKEDKHTQTEEMHSRCTLPDTIRPLLASPQALHDVSANNAAAVYKLCTDGHIEDAVSRQTAEKCLIEYSLALFGTCTYFGRAFNEFHITGPNVTELIGLVDTIGNTALDMLNQFILCWARVNDVEKRYGMPLTPIYAITSMTSDTTSSMSGEHGGFQALFERARLGAWIHDGSPSVYKVSTCEQCDNHVTNLVRTLFNQKAVQSFEHNGLTYLVYNKKTGGKLAVHYHLTLTRRLAKQVLTFKCAEFAHLKAEQDTREGKSDHAPPLQRTSFNRFATFGTGAQNLMQYAEVFKTLVRSEVELLEDDNVQFLLELECAYSSRFELPFLKESYQMGVVPSEDYETWHTGYMQAI